MTCAPSLTVSEYLNELPRRSALVVGDVCLDRWCTYEPDASEPSRETGIPRIAVVKTTVTPGAGGTIANNLAALIADAFSSDAKELDRARQLVEQFRNASDPLLIDTLGWVLVRQGSYEDATILLAKASSLAPTNQQIAFHYAMALKGKGLQAKAKEALAKALAGTPDYRGLDGAKALATALN